MDVTELAPQLPIGRFKLAAHLDPEQLGLKLVDTKAHVPVLVIDRIGQPAPD